MREPGAGRAKLRLSRGLPLCLTLQRQPPQFLVWARFTPLIYWGDVACRVSREAPAQAELRPTCAGVPSRVIPQVGSYARYGGVQNLRLFSPASRRVAATNIARSEFPPSVTSVASVRCFPREVCFSPASRRVAANQFRPNPNFPPL